MESEYGSDVSIPEALLEPPAKGKKRKRKGQKQRQREWRQRQITEDKAALSSNEQHQDGHATAESTRANSNSPDISHNIKDPRMAVTSLVSSNVIPTSAQPLRNTEAGVDVERALALPSMARVVPTDTIYETPGSLSKEKSAITEADNVEHTLDVTVRPAIGSENGGDSDVDNEDDVEYDEMILTIVKALLSREKRNKTLTPDLTTVNVWGFRKSLWLSQFDKPEGKAKVTAATKTLNQREQRSVQHLTDRLKVHAVIETLESAYKCFGDCTPLIPLIPEAKLYPRSRREATLDEMKSICWLPDKTDLLLGPARAGTSTTIDQTELEAELAKPITDGSIRLPRCQFAFQAGSSKLCNVPKKENSPLRRKHFPLIACGLLDVTHMKAFVACSESGRKGTHAILIVPIRKYLLFLGRLEFSHMCGNRHCVSPWHTTIESNADNMSRETCFKSSTTDTSCKTHWPPCNLLAKRTFATTLLTHLQELAMRPFEKLRARNTGNLLTRWDVARQIYQGGFLMPCEPRFVGKWFHPPRGGTGRGRMRCKFCQEVNTSCIFPQQGASKCQRCQKRGLSCLKVDLWEL